MFLSHCLVGPYFRIPLSTRTLVYEPTSMMVWAAHNHLMLGPAGLKHSCHRLPAWFSPVLLFVIEQCYHTKLPSWAEADSSEC